MRIPASSATDRQRWGARTHTAAVPGCLFGCQCLPDLQACCFPQPKTSQANRHLNKYTASLEYIMLVFIKRTIAELQWRTPKASRTNPLHLPSKQTKVQDLCFPLQHRSLASQASSASRGQTYLAGCRQPLVLPYISQAPPAPWPASVLASLRTQSLPEAPVIELFLDIHDFNTRIFDC